MTKFKEERIKAYLLNPTTCPQCNSPLPYERRNEKFCNQKCSGIYTNQKKKDTRQPVLCLQCGKQSEPLPYYKSKHREFCNNICQSEYQYSKYIKEWKEGKVDGRRSGGYASTRIKRYLIETMGEQCSICTWHERNPFTLKVPLVLDHVDGNCLNCAPNNLRLICNNCDSLSQTFKGGNKGKGRKSQGVTTYR